MGDLARPRLLSAWQTLDTAAGALLVRRAVNGSYPAQALGKSAAVWAYGADTSTSPNVVPAAQADAAAVAAGWELP